MALDFEVIGRGVYSIREAARLTRLRPRRVNEWFRGRTSAGRTSRPLFQSDYPILEGQQALTFLNLVELKVAGLLRDGGMSPRDLRATHERLEAQLGDHPFSRRAIAGAAGRDDLDRAILPFLDQLEYDPGTGKAARWRPAHMVAIDPAYRFGDPLVAEVGIPTSTLRASYYANDESAEVVAHWFGVEPAHVLAAVAFEDGLVA